MGSVMSSLLTPKDLPLPGFIGVGGTAQRIGPGFLGMINAPFSVQNAGQPPANIKAPDSLGKDMEERQRRRQRLFYAVEDNFADNQFPHVRDEVFSKEKDAHERDKKLVAEREALGSSAQSHETIYKKAFDLTVSPLKTVFEVRNEPKKVIDEYGGMNNGFGMGCLLARKLGEKGVTCVEVDLGGWDMHANVFNSIRTGNGPRLDKGMGSLVKDLVERGMWKNTVVLWMGEFGRTPRINQNAGRDHWARCWSVVIGGGAIRGGQAYGTTDADGLAVATNPVRVPDLFATVYRGLGIDPATQVRDAIGRPFNISGLNGRPIAGLI
jgi:hypothetical protein